MIHDSRFHALIGASFATVNNLVTITVSGITLSGVLTTIVFAFIGATIGYFTSKFWKYIDKRFGKKS